MRSLGILLLLVAGLALGQTAPVPTLADTSVALDGMELDSSLCFRVRDVALDRGDLRFYFTDGWLILAKPAAGRTMAGLFVRSGAGDDAELSVLPPSTGERMSLARFTGAPNLNEHLDTVVMLFTDETAAELRAAIATSNRPEPSPEQGLLLKARFDSVVRNLVDSFRLRLIENLRNGRAGANGFFYSAMVGRRLGNFDALFDPYAARQVFLGQLADRNGRSYYDVWTAFRARSFRNQTPAFAGQVASEHRIEATLAPDLSMDVTATSKITLSREARVLVFDLSDRLTVSSVTVDGEPAEVLYAESLRSNRMRSSETSQFLVLPARPMEPGRAHDVRFAYAGKVITEMGKDVYTVGSRSSWYPSNGLQFSRFDITFLYPENLDVVFPGEIKEQATQNGIKRVRRVMAQPVRLAGFNVGHYESKDVSRGGLTVTIYGNHDLEARLRPELAPIVIPAPQAPFARPGARREVMILPPPPPPDPLARLSPLADEIATAFEYYAQTFGPPATQHLMVSPIPGAFGQGFPGLVYLSTLAYLNAGERPEGARNAASQLFFSETLHAHETAHQWWGNVVATSTESDEWLMEALASYSSLMMLEKRKGAKELHRVFDQYRDHLLSPVEDDARDGQPGEVTGEVGEKETRSRESVGPLRLGDRLDNSLVPGAWQAVIYEKGAWVIHMLRRRMGDAAFTAFLKGFAAKYRLQNVTTEQFFEAAAAAMPKDLPDRKLEAFVDSWVEGTGIPKLTLESKVSGKAPNLRLTVTVKQSGVSERFSTVVPVVVQFASGKPRTLLLETGPDAASQTIPIAVKPSKVTLDPDGSVLRR